MTNAMRFSEGLACACAVPTIQTAVPSMSDAQAKNWEDRFFKLADKIDASIEYGPTKILGDSAEASFTMKLKILYKDTRTGNLPLNQHATLKKGADGWHIVQLR